MSEDTKSWLKTAPDEDGFASWLRANKASLFDSEPFRQIRGQTSMATDVSDHERVEQDAQS